jgi:hypothetical protein
VLFCGYCERRMQGTWNNQQAYYRCRLPARHATGSDLDHPKAVYLREARILDEVGGWLTTAFGPDRLEHTIAVITEQAVDPDETVLADLRKRLSKCDRKLSQCRSALDARGDLIEVFSWHNATTNEGAGLKEEQKAVPAAQPFHGTEIRSLIEEIGDMVRLVAEADPDDKAKCYLRLGLKRTYHPDKQYVEARVESDSPRGRSADVRAKLHESPT